MFKINETFGLSADKFQTLMIAVSELAFNAIVHGNKEQMHKKVAVVVEYNDKEMFIKISDEGNGINIDSIPDPTLDENITKESGRGIFIVKSLVDDFGYKHTHKGSEFTIVVRK